MALKWHIRTSAGFWTSVRLRLWLEGVYPWQHFLVVTAGGSSFTTRFGLAQLGQVQPCMVWSHSVCPTLWPGPAPVCSGLIFPLWLCVKCIFQVCKDQQNHTGWNTIGVYFFTVFFFFFSSYCEEWGKCTKGEKGNKGQVVKFQVIIILIFNSYLFIYLFYFLL